MKVLILTEGGRNIGFGHITRCISLYQTFEERGIMPKFIGGTNAVFSLEPEEFKAMVKSVREVEKALGEVSYELTEDMKKSREFSRSLFVIKDMNAGEIFTEKNVRSVRPGYGLPPKHLKDILGKKTKENIKKGTPLSWEIIKK